MGWNNPEIRKIFAAVILFDKFAFKNILLKVKKPNIYQKNGLCCRYAIDRRKNMLS